MQSSNSRACTKCEGQTGRNFQDSCFFITLYGEQVMWKIFYVPNILLMREEITRVVNTDMR